MPGPEGDAQRLLPLSPLSLSILLALADGARHGYGIMKEVERLTDGQVRSGAGSLYAALQRLSAEGLVAEADALPGEDARRRNWALTAFGRTAARAEVLRLARTLEHARDKRLLPGLRVTLPGEA